MDVTGGMEASVDEVAVDPPSPDFMEGGERLALGRGRACGATTRRGGRGRGPLERSPHAERQRRVARRPGTDRARLGASTCGARRAGASACPRRRRPELRLHRTVSALAGDLRRSRRGDTTTTEQIANRFGGPTSAPEPTVPLRFDVEFSMTVDPGRTTPTRRTGSRSGRNTGTSSCARPRARSRSPERRSPSTGGGLRIRRKGTMERSDYSDWMGHVWMSAQFASGRAFGIDNFHPYPDGSVRYHEGWVLDDGEILPAKFVDAPWKTDWVASGEDVSFVLRTKRGDVPIDAETYVTTVQLHRRTACGTSCVSRHPARHHPLPLGRRGGLRHDRTLVPDRTRSDV